METGSKNSNTENVYPQNVLNNTPPQKLEVVSDKKGPSIVLIIVIIVVLIVIAATVIFAFSQGTFSRIFSGPRSLRNLGGAESGAYNTYVSPIKVSNDYIQSFGFIYTVATTVRTLQPVENNNLEITTTITDPDFPKKLTVSGGTRILGLNNEQEKLVGKKALKEGMNVHMSLSYNLQNKKWFVTKLVIQDVPYDQLVKNNPATGSAELD